MCEKDVRPCCGTEWTSRHEPDCEYKAGDLK